MRFARFDKGLGDHSFWVAVLLRLAPILPFGPTSYALGATRISPRMYALTTLVGTVPTSLLYAYTGSLLHRVSQLGTARSGHHSISLAVGVGATLAASLLVGWIAKRALDRAAKA